MHVGANAWEFYQEILSRGDRLEVLELQGRLYVVVGLCGCIFARARVPRAYLERVKKHYTI